MFIDQNLNLRIGDFGRISERAVDTSSNIGTRGINPMEVDEGNYSGKAVDLFAASFMLFTMLFGSPPWNASDLKKTPNYYLNFFTHGNSKEFWN